MKVKLLNVHLLQHLIYPRKGIFLPLSEALTCPSTTSHWKSLLYFLLLENPQGLKFWADWGAVGDPGFLQHSNLTDGRQTLRLLPTGCSDEAHLNYAQNFAGILFWICLLVAALWFKMSHFRVWGCSKIIKEKKKRTAKKGAREILNLDSLFLYLHSVCFSNVYRTE